MKSCLFVIDAQQSFRHRPYSSERDMPDYLAAQNALIAGCEARGLPVVRILHVDAPATKDNPFAIESGHVVPLEGLIDFTPAAAFTKGRHSALVGTAPGWTSGSRNTASSGSSSAAFAPSNAAKPPPAMPLIWAGKWTLY